MGRRKSGLATRIEYYPLRALLGGLQALPHPMSRAASRRLLPAILAFIPKRRNLVRSQISRAFPEFSARRVQQVADHSIRTLADGLATFARMGKMTLPQMERVVETVGFEHIDEAYRQGRGMITFTAHYGCWELMANYVTRRYPRVAMTVRPLDNPRLDALVSGLRRSGGGGVIDSRKVLKEGLRLLRANGILGILIDQNFHKGGVFVNFFGQPAATSTLVPVLARRTGCAVLPMHNRWHGDKIQIICEAPVALSRDVDPSRAIARDTQTLTSYVERWIREDPEQWLWLHSRWKRKPEKGEWPPAD